MFFELRQYRMKPGKNAEWVKLMEEVIIPFQVSKGMVIVGSFTSPEEEDLYIWLRRFESEEERVALYEAVYQSDFWKNEVSPQVGELIDREQIKVTRITPTPKSVIR
ncbi:MAG: NIPSNAP family protein [Caldilineaceae bacterium]